jgi:hypothetical protein
VARGLANQVKRDVRRVELEALRQFGHEGMGANWREVCATRQLPDPCAEPPELRLEGREGERRDLADRADAEGEEPPMGLGVDRQVADGQGGEQRGAATPVDEARPTGLGEQGSDPRRELPIGDPDLGSELEGGSHLLVDRRDEGTFPAREGVAPLQAKPSLSEISRLDERAEGRQGATEPLPRLAAAPPMTSGRSRSSGRARRSRAIGRASI